MDKRRRTIRLLVTSIALALVATAPTPAGAVDLSAQAPNDFVNRPGWAGVGVRAPLGMSIRVRNNPVELFFEIAPQFTVRSSAAPAQGRYTIYADGAIGLRYYP